MGARGPKGGTALSVVAPVGLDEVRRPAPPLALNPEQRNEWLEVVNRLPADWFPRETHALLAQYCRHVVAAQRIAQLIEHAEAESEIDIGEYDKLLQMQEREGRAMSSLATRMRLTQQATYDKERQKASKPVRTWAIAQRAGNRLDPGESEGT